MFNERGKSEMFKRVSLIAASAALAMPTIADAHAVAPTHFLETAKPYAPYEFLIGDWYSKIADPNMTIHQQFKWGPGKSYIVYTSFLAVPGKPEQLHFGGMMVWDGKTKALDFLFALQPGSGAQEKGTVTIQPDGTILREVAMTTPKGDLAHFRQTFRKVDGGKIITSMTEQTATGWKLEPPGEIVMERVLTTPQTESSQ